MIRLDVLPAPPMENVADSPVADAKPSSQFRLAKLSAQDADLENLSYGQLCPAVVFAARRNAHGTGVADVFGTGDPFEVGRAVVSPHAIDVIGFLSRSGWPSEGGEDEAVNEEAHDLAPTVEANLEIPVVVRLCLENVANTRTPGPPSTPYPSEVRDFIEAFVADNGLPGFKGGCARLRVHREPPFSVSCGRAPHSVAATLII